MEAHSHGISGNLAMRRPAGDLPADFPSSCSVRSKNRLDHYAFRTVGASYSPSILIFVLS
jgi:hypothetical protein